MVDSYQIEEADEALQVFFCNNKINIAKRIASVKVLFEDSLEILVSKLEKI